MNALSAGTAVALLPGMARCDVEILPVPLAVERALVFVDVVAFTQMTERLGDVVAQRVMSAHRARIAGAAGRWGGEVVEARGDGFLLAFADADLALFCAAEIQAALRRDSLRAPGRAIAVRIGVHQGCVLPEPGGYFGRNVIVAARICECAQPNEILLSDEVRARVSARPELALGRERRVDLKGFVAQQRVFALLGAEQPALAAAAGR